MSAPHIDTTGAMDFSTFAALAAGLIGGFWLGTKASHAAAQSTIEKARVSQAHDRNNFLELARRQIANLLIWRDPDRFLRTYELLHTEGSAISELRPEALRARLEELCKKYPNYGDFDAFGTRDYVLYPDAASMLSLDDLEKRYRDAMLFAALSIATDKEWKYFHATDADELDHLREYISRIKDTVFRSRLMQAMREYYLAADHTDGLADTFETANYLIRRVDHFAESRRGIHLKHTGEYGLHTYFLSDEGKGYEGYYRSDPGFEKQQSLRALGEVLDDIKLAQIS